jgi:hypothetical protein
MKNIGWDYFGRLTMELVLILLLCFSSLFIVEVFLGGALPDSFNTCQGRKGSKRLGRMKMGAFFGQALPLAAAGIGLPMSLQHPWAILLVVLAAVLYIVVCRIMKAC